MARKKVKGAKQIIAIPIKVMSPPPKNEVVCLHIILDGGTSHILKSEPMTEAEAQNIADIINRAVK